MSIIRTFCDNLYFSVCCTLVVFLVLYCLISAVDGSFSLEAYLLHVLAGFVGASAGLAGFLTYLTIRNQPKNTIEFTRRQE